MRLKLSPNPVAILDQILVWTAGSAAASWLLCQITRKFKSHKTAKIKVTKMAIQTASRWRSASGRARNLSK